jgi:hypothetical protein
VGLTNLVQDRKEWRGIVNSTRGGGLLLYHPNAPRPLMELTSIRCVMTGVPVIKLVQAVTILICIRDMPSSNLGLDTDYLD